jgi:hypothetical protein
MFVLALQSCLYAFKINLFAAVDLASIFAKVASSLAYNTTKRDIPSHGCLRLAIFKLKVRVDHPLAFPNLYLPSKNDLKQHHVQNASIQVNSLKSGT